MRSTLLVVCPHCGAAKNDFQSWEGYYYDTGTNTLTGPFEGKVRVNAAQGVLLFMLLRGHGRAVPTGTLIDGLWGHASCDISHPHNTIAVHMTKLRELLKPAGLTIPTNYRRRCGSYHLEIIARTERSEGTRGPPSTTTNMPPTIK